MHRHEVSAALKAIGATEDEAEAAAQAREQGNPAQVVRLLFLRGLWSEVLDEKGGLEKWLELEPSSFPFLNFPALRRLLEAGVQTDDLVDVIRSAQTLLIYNVANMLDDGGGLLPYLADQRLAGDWSWQLVAVPPDNPVPEHSIADLHESLEGMDPAGRFSEPRLLEERLLATMTLEQREAILAPLDEKKESQAALAWHRATSSGLTDAREAVRRLARIKEQLVNLRLPRTTAEPDLDLALKVAVGADAWLSCPRCRRRFKSTDSRAYAEGRHVRCGQLLELVANSPSGS
jgi:hypothetical protein